MVVLNKRVLVVDDEQIVRDSCRRVLTDAGYAVRVAGSGCDAIEACRAERFDVMLTDLRMPDMQGMDVVRAVAKEFPEIRVIIITGYPSQSSALQAGKLGVFDYLEKPLSPERLSEATAGALSQPSTHATTGFPPAVPALAETGPMEAELQQQPETEAAVLTEAPVRIEAPHSDLKAPAAEQLGEVDCEEAVETEVSVLKVLALLAISPLIGLAFVVFMPLLGFGMLFAAVGSGLFTKSGRGKTELAPDSP